MSQESRTVGENGFTLIELMIVTVILPIVIGAIVFALVSLFSLQGSVSNRVSNSADAQIVSANFVSDIQEASSFTTDGSSSPQCVPPGQGAGSTQVLGLQTNSGETVISYEEVPVPGGTNHLVRSLCEGGVNSSPHSSEVVSSNAPSGLTAGITCTSVSSSCTSLSYKTSWIPTTGLLHVDLTVGESAGSDNFSFTLTAAPRDLNPSPTAATAGGLLPLLLLSTSPSEVSCTGQGKVSVAGEIALDSSSAGGASTSGQAAVSASSFYTADTTNPTAALSGDFTVGANGPAPSTTTNPPTLTSGPVLADPYAAFNNANTIATLTADGNLSTVTADGNYHGPGIYTTQLNIAGQTNLQFASGIYIFEHGISVSGQATISTAAGGVLFYVSGGSISLMGQNGATLAPLTSPPSPIANPIANVTIWQAPSDTSPLALSGQATANTLHGIIYAPGATVDDTGQGALTAGAIVANGLTCSGQGGLTITGTPAS